MLTRPSSPPRSTRPTPAPVATPISPPSIQTIISRRSRPPVPNATRRNPRATGPVSMAWRRPKGKRAPPRAVIATTATPFCRPPRRPHRSISPDSPRPAADAMTRRPRTSRKAFMAKPSLPATAKRPPAPIATRSIRSPVSRAVPRCKSPPMSAATATRPSG